MSETCPSVAHVLRRVDGGLVRIRVPGGRITAPQLAVVADAALEFGADVIEITNRANLQLRGVEPSEAGRLAVRLTDAGLSDGAAGDRRRNIVAGPLAGLDPTETADVTGLLHAVRHRFAADPRLDALSPKYGVTLDGGGRWHLRGRRDDAVVTALPGAGALRDGAGALRDEAGALRDEAGALRDGAGALRDGAGALRDGAGGARFELRVAAQPVRVVDCDDVAEELRRAALSSLGGRRRRVVSAPLGPGAPPATAVGPLGIGPQSDPARCWVGVMPVLGRINAATAHAAAGWADRYGSGSLRLTPWRGLVVGDVAAPAASEALAAAGALGLVTAGEDPAAAVVACAGTGCPASRTDATNDARAVIAGRRQHGPGLTNGPSLVHVSGCEKRCAHHDPAPVTLVGVGRHRYDVLVADDSAPGGERRLAASVEASEAVSAAVARTAIAAAR